MAKTYAELLKDAVEGRTSAVGGNEAGNAINNLNAGLLGELISCYKKNDEEGIKVLLSAASQSDKDDDEDVDKDDKGENADKIDGKKGEKAVDKSTKKSSENEEDDDKVKKSVKLSAKDSDEKNDIYDQLDNLSEHIRKMELSKSARRTLEAHLRKLHSKMDDIVLDGDE